MTATVPGALAIQDHLARTTWATRPGSPQTSAPLVRDERVVIQVAHGDETVPNPTSFTIADAGDLPAHRSGARPGRAGPVWEVPVVDPSVLLDLDFPQPVLRP